MKQLSSYTIILISAHLSDNTQVMMPTTKVYATRSDMSHTTCWIRHMLRMSDRVSPPKTPRDTIVYDISDRVS